MSVYHVVPNHGDGYDWLVKKTGTGTKSRHRTKQRAIGKATTYQGRGDSVVVHRQDGTVQRSL
jgi:hypothetical protein